jgi:hypothetical protein
MASPTEVGHHAVSGELEQEKNKSNESSGNSMPDDRL